MQPKRCAEISPRPLWVPYSANSLRGCTLCAESGISPSWAPRRASGSAVATGHGGWKPPLAQTVPSGPPPRHAAKPPLNTAPGWARCAACAAEIQCLEHAHLAALAEEDRAALSGRPRKANAGQYEIVLHQGPYESVMQQRAPWPQAPERTGPRSAAVLVRRMQASKRA